MNFTEEQKNQLIEVMDKVFKECNTEINNLMDQKLIFEYELKSGHRIIIPAITQNLDLPVKDYWIYPSKIELVGKGIHGVGLKNMPEYASKIVSPILSDLVIDENAAQDIVVNLKNNKNIYTEIEFMEHLKNVIAKNN